MGHSLLQIFACFLLCCGASTAKAQRSYDGVKREVRGTMLGKEEMEDD